MLVGGTSGHDPAICREAMRTAEIAPRVNRHAARIGQGQPTSSTRPVLQDGSPAA